MSGIKDQYFLRLKFGEDDIPINSSIMNIFSIIQDSNKFLPSAQISLKDSSGILTHMVPSDSRMNKVRVEIGYGMEDKPANSFDFSVIRRKPRGQTTDSATLEINCLLNTADYLFGKSSCRSFNGSIKDTLTSIAINDLKLDEVDISPSLDYSKLIIQPHWTISQLLLYLEERLEGKEGETGYKCFIKRDNHKSILVFRTLDELIAKKRIYKFIVNQEAIEDNIPVLSYSIFDNYKMFGLFSSKKQAYGYFDYTNSEYVTGENDALDSLALSKCFLIDKDDSETSDRIINTGTNSDFTNNFTGLTNNNYKNRLNGLLKMWITTPGMANLTPGQTVQVAFGRGTGMIEEYQYSGYWLVERIVHSFGDTYLSNILLTRNGVDTREKTTLLEATTLKRI
jgi:hypothetical protein